MRAFLKARRAHNQKKAKLLINPQDSRFLSWWDCVTTWALMHTALVTPVEIAFVNQPGLALDVINILIDLIFTYLGGDSD